MRFNSNLYWKSDILNDLCEFYKGNGISKDDLSSEGCNCILYGQLYTTYLNEVITKVVSKTSIKLANPFYSKINDLIIPSSGEDPIDIAVARSIQVENVLLGGDLNILRPKNDINSSFLSYQLNGKRKLDIAKIAQGKSIVHLHNSDLKNIRIYYPCMEEQSKIATLLLKIDKRIETQIKIIEDLKSQKNMILNKVFKELFDTPNGIIGDYIKYEQPSKYLVDSKDYVSKSDNVVPVLTANQAFILGYTEESYGIYDKGDCIIFDDFTMDSKFVDFNFKVKSSAIKILTAKENINIKYFFEYLQYLNLFSTEHKRHYLSEVEKKPICVPPINIQENILTKLSIFNSKIKNEEIILHNYELQKNYLLDNMFI